MFTERYCDISHISINTKQSKLTLTAELGTRQHRRDNVSMLTSHKIVGYYIMSLFVVATSFRH